MSNKVIQDSDRLLEPHPLDEEVPAVVSFEPPPHDLPLTPYQATLEGQIERYNVLDSRAVAAIEDAFDNYLSDYTGDLADDGKPIPVSKQTRDIRNKIVLLYLEKRMPTLTQQRKNRPDDESELFEKMRRHFDAMEVTPEMPDVQMTDADAQYFQNDPEGQAVLRGIEGAVEPDS